VAKRRSQGSGRGGFSRETKALGVLGVALGIFWLLALASYMPEAQASRPDAPPLRNVSGIAGARLAGFSLALVGWPGSLATIAALTIAAAHAAFGRRAWRRPVPALVAVVVIAPPILALMGATGAAGAYGSSVSGVLTRLLGGAGAWIVTIGVALAALLVSTDIQLRLPRARGARVILDAGTALRERLVVAGGALLARARDRLARARAARERRGDAVRIEGAPPAEETYQASGREPHGDAIRVAPDLDGRSFDGSEIDEDPALIDPFAADAGAGPAPRPAPRREVRRSPETRKRAAADYESPRSDLLPDPPQGTQTISRRALIDLSETLCRTLDEFGIRGRVGEVHPGPVITRYDFEPAPGVKVMQVVSREDDIALALRTDRIRILPRVPGKAAVGIEIPNERPDLIHFKEILVSRAYTESKGILSLILGKDAMGRPFVDHLERMPHLLVAGTTGSGKSVCVNTIIASLLFRHRPENLRLILIDPKMLELTGYNGIPHLALPVVTESKEASKALGWLVREMERRYRVLAARGVRNVATYHAKFLPDGEPVRGPDDEEDPERMPYIVCVVDELADLMMQYASEVETPIARLAQMARAVGIHLILATQRPSVDVITGVIKANFPARIAFQVASRTDSRTILDQNGAESLIGRGDMLYLPAGRPAPVRLHGAFLPDADIETLVGYLRGFAATDDPIELDEKSGEAGGLEDELDPLFGDAARTVVLQGQASTSLLQRRLKIGYARAGRLMDQLEQGGIVGGFEGSKAREVLVDMEELTERGLV
jgi:S-DNA-T family DNA segregation ATPase FtsK/SpoIIIE